MASKSSATKKVSRDPSTIGNVPLTAYDRAKAQWAEMIGSTVVEKNRWFLVAFTLALAVLVSAYGYNHLLPLKSVEPFLIEVEKFSGEPRPSAMRAASYQPQEKEIQFFLARWIRQMLEIGPSTIDDLQEAYGYCRGNALEEFTEYLRNSEVFAKMKADPSLRRTLDISSITFIQERVALVRLVSKTRTLRGAPEEKRFIINVNFELDPPKEKEKFLVNPLGFFITHFDFREELK